MSRFHAYLELSRLSNLPTVWTNALVGLYAGYTAALVTSGFAPALTGLSLLLEALNQGFMLLLSLSCLYAGGMALNDLCDVEIDQRERPHRPIPSGRISPAAARTFITVLFVVGVLGLAVYNPLTLGLGIALALTIIAYNLTHQRFPAAVLLMGGCRTLVYLTAASAVPILEAPTWAFYVLPFAVCVGVYIVLITVIARAETDSTLGGRRWLALLMPLFVLAPALLIGPARGDWIWVVALVVVLLLWLTHASRHAQAAHPPRTPQAVMAWISGICLIDAYYLALLDQPHAALLAAACFIVTALAHRRIAGT